jgi:NRPS condensation-like uncharacterized protein
MDRTAEVFDQVQLLFALNGFNDHQVHCVLRFEHGPDADVLKKAVLSSIDAIPILGTRYVAGARPRWTSLDPNDFTRAFVIARTEVEFEDFVVSRVDEGIGPQVRVCLLGSVPCALAFKINHMVCDAAGFKEYLYFLCEIYSGVIADPAYRPPAITVDRSMRGVLKRFSIGVKFKSLLLQSKENNRTGGDRFPLSDGGEVRPFILTRKLASDKTEGLKHYGRSKGATLNDVVLTALYRCVFQRLNLTPGTELRIPVMVDMRRYLGESSKFSMTNLSSMVITRLEYKPDERFEGTLGRVKATMDDKKGSNIGLNGFVKLNLMYRIFGDSIANRLLRSSLKFPLICMTNVGIVDAAKLSFGGRRPHDAFLCGSIKYKPYFQLAMSSYNDELTLSVNLYGSAADRDRVLSFLGEIDGELTQTFRQ